MRIARAKPALEAANQWPWGDPPCSAQPGRAVSGGAGGVGVVV